MRRPYTVQIEVAARELTTDATDEFKALRFTASAVDRSERGWVRIRLDLHADGLAQACFRAAHAAQAVTGAEPLSCWATTDAAEWHPQPTDADRGNVAPASAPSRQALPQQLATRDVD